MMQELPVLRQDRMAYLGSSRTPQTLIRFLTLLHWLFHRRRMLVTTLIVVMLLHLCRVAEDRGPSDRVLGFAARVLAALRK